MYIGLHHCLNVLFVCVCSCVLFYVSMDPRGLIQIKWMDGWIMPLTVLCAPTSHNNMNAMLDSGHTLQVGVTMLLLMMMHDDAALISCTAVILVVTIGSQSYVGLP